MTNQRAGLVCNCIVPMATTLGRCGYCAGNLRVDTGPTFDPTQIPGVDQLPATTTNLTPEQFQQWLDMPGRLFIVYLGPRRSFVIKVPDEHHAFFVDMLKQLRLTLGPEVQAQSAIPLPPAETDIEARPPERLDQ